MAQNEKDLRELAMTIHLERDSVDRKLGGVFYQLENPEFKQNFNKMLNYPAKGSFEDWLTLSTLPKQPIDFVWDHPIIVEMREVLQTRQAGIEDDKWNAHQACKKDEVLRQ